MGKVLIDGDIIAYRAAFSVERKKDVVFQGGKKNTSTFSVNGRSRIHDPWGGISTPQDAKDKVDELIEFILKNSLLNPELGVNYEVYLTGKGNFRDDIAKSYIYKGNRKDIPKPKHLKTARDRMKSKYKAIISCGEEADDLISKEAARLDYKACVASIDKDMLQIPCWHFNIVRGDYVKVEPFGGLKFFYTQILTGDSVDNIVGLFGVGPAKAKKILDGAETEEELWDCVVKAYDGNEDRVTENARLLWLRRSDGEIWNPPK